jgi:predicted TIM-barrel fold metal-dependent hydrolase
MQIDAHVHVWKAHPEFGQPTATIVGPHVAVPVELLDAYLDEHGVARAVLVQPIYPGEDNSYVADCAAARPERFAAVCVVDPRKPDAAEQLGYWVRERGCRGLRLRPRIPAEGAVFGVKSTYPLWEAAEELGVVVSMLGGAEHLPILKSLADQFHNVSIVVDHLADPDPSALADSPERRALLELAACDNVSLKISGYYYYSREAPPYADCHSLMQALLQRFGAGRLIWGSDFPHVLLKTTYGSTRDLPERMLPTLSSSDRAKILGGNALRLYWDA